MTDEERHRCLGCVAPKMADLRNEARGAHGTPRAWQIGMKRIRLVQVGLAAGLVFGIELTTTPDNAGAIALAERLGFVREGVLRRRVVERGRAVDIVWFGLLREEWAR